MHLRMVQLQKGAAAIAFFHVHTSHQKFVFVFIRKGPQVVNGGDFSALKFIFSQIDIMFAHVFLRLKGFDIVVGELVRRQAAYAFLVAVLADMIQNIPGIGLAAEMSVVKHLTAVGVHILENVARMGNDQARSLPLAFSALSC